MILVAYFHKMDFGFSFSAGSFFISGGGQLYMWGKLKNTGDDWMYPKPLMDLRLYYIPKLFSVYKIFLISYLFL